MFHDKKTDKLVNMDTLNITYNIWLPHIPYTNNTNASKIPVVTILSLMMSQHSKVTRLSHRILKTWVAHLKIAMVDKTF